MKDTTRIKIALDIEAQKIISQVILHNEQLADLIESGVKKAVAQIDFEEEVRKITHHTIQDTLSSILKYGDISSTIKGKIQEALNKYLGDKIDSVVSAIISKD